MHEHGACRLTPSNHHSHALPFTWLRPCRVSRIPQAIAVGSTKTPSKAKPAPSDAENSPHLLFNGCDLTKHPASPKLLPSGLRKHQARLSQHRRTRKAAHIHFFRKNKVAGKSPEWRRSELNGDIPTDVPKPKDQGRAARPRPTKAGAPTTRPRHLSSLTPLKRS